MQFNVSVKMNLHIKEVEEKVRAAARAALRDCIVDTEHDSKEGSPKRTGNNMRSITSEIGPGGELNLEELQGAVFSTSGYGGFLETGTVKMSPRPYMKPAADKNFTEAKMAARMKEHLGES